MYPERLPPPETDRPYVPPEVIDHGHGSAKIGTNQVVEIIFKTQVFKCQK